MKKQKVALGMSGGVDSSLCAYLLKEQGYDVTGVYLECWRAPGCRTEEDRKDALKVALELGIPFQVLDFKQAYKDKVVENFFAEYAAGRTPNPDVLCNKEIKFGLFYDWAMEQGFDFVATGHYAQIVDSRQWVVNRGRETVDSEQLPGDSGQGTVNTGQNPASSIQNTAPTSHNLHLATSRDSKKDQTYFLHRLRQEQLEHILFPIGHLTKSQVRQEAQRRNIPVAQKPDSQGICFIGEINVHNFLKDRLGEQPGEVVNTAGEVMGKHNGLWFYTVGQRHGFEIFGKWKSQRGELRHAMPPYYVITKIPERNQLVVGFGAETYRSEFFLEDVHWIDQGNRHEALGNDGQVDTYNLLPTSYISSLFVRIRHGGKLIPCTLEIRDQISGTVVNNKSRISLPAMLRIAMQVGNLKSLRCVLSEPVQGIADGQSAVFYMKAADRGQRLEVQEKRIELRNDQIVEANDLHPTSYIQYVCLGGGVIG